MSYWKDATPHGFPPERDAFEPFPKEIPWDMPIHELPHLWLHIEGGGVTVNMPLPEGEVPAPLRCHEPQ